MQLRPNKLKMYKKVLPSSNLSHRLGLVRTVRTECVDRGSVVTCDGGVQGVTSPARLDT